MRQWKTDSSDSVCFGAPPSEFCLDWCEQYEAFGALCLLHSCISTDITSALHMWKELFPDWGFLKSIQLQPNTSGQEARPK